VTRWPTRPRTGLEFGEAFQVALGGYMWMSEVERADFAERWRAGRDRLEVEHPDSADLWATLDGMFR
jgi:hypothetical protein